MSESNRLIPQADIDAAVEPDREHTCYSLSFDPAVPGGDYTVSGNSRGMTVQPTALLVYFDMIGCNEFREALQMGPDYWFISDPYRKTLPVPLCNYCGGTGLKHFGGTLGRGREECYYCPCKICKRPYWTAWNWSLVATVIVRRLPSFEVVYDDDGTLHVPIDRLT